MCRILTFATLILLVSAGMALPAEKTKTGQYFVDQCDSAQPSALCGLTYQAVLTRLAFDDRRTCQPEFPSERFDEMRPEYHKQIHRIVAWLKRHPDSLAKWFVDAVFDALSAEYPCGEP